MKYEALFLTPSEEYYDFFFADIVSGSERDFLTPQSQRGIMRIMDNSMWCDAMESSCSACVVSYSDCMAADATTLDNIINAWEACQGSHPVTSDCPDGGSTDIPLPINASLSSLLLFAFFYGVFAYRKRKNSSKN